MIVAVASPRRIGAQSCSRALLLLLLAAAMSADGRKQQHQDRARGSRSLGPHPESRVSRLSDLAKWRTITFDFEGNETREQQYRNWGSYNPASILIIDADLVDGEMYVTTPPFKNGTPASFSVVTGAQVLEPPVKPFPSWEAHATTRHALTDCATQMVSVFRSTRVPSDPSTMYLIDSGIVDISSTFEKMCPPKIVTLDLLSRTIVTTTVIDKEACNSLYIAIQVEETSEGKRVAYSADVTGFALAVTYLSTGETRRIFSQDYYPTPGKGVTTIGGVRSFLMDGLFTLGIANDSLYSWAFASNTLNKVATQVLRNASDNQILDLTVQTLVSGERAGPSGALAIDPSGRRMFFGIAEQEALYCWDTRKPYQQSHFRFLESSPERFQFFSSIKQLPSNKKLIVVTDRYNKFAENIVDQESVNYRVMSMNIINLTC